MKIKLFSGKGRHVAFNRLRQLRIVAAVLLMAEISLLGYGISGCSNTVNTTAPETEVMTAELRASSTMINPYEKRVKTAEGKEKLEISLPSSFKYKNILTNSLVRKLLESAANAQAPAPVEVDINETTEPKQVDPSTIKSYFTEEEITEMNAWMEEPVSLSYEDIYTEEYLAELKETNYAEYLASLPWTSTKEENMWIDNSDKSQDDPDWLPGLKVSNITADMMTIPGWMSETEFHHVVNMIANECGNAENDEVMMYTGGVLMNRIWYDTYFINNYGGIDGNLLAPGQYTGLYVQESEYQRLTQTDNFDIILRNAYLVVNGYYNMPKNVCFQAEFTQGKGCWKAIHISTDYWTATEYFCYTLTKIEGCD